MLSAVPTQVVTLIWRQLKLRNPIGRVSQLKLIVTFVTGARYVLIR